jgi:hypothetical protein
MLPHQLLNYNTPCRRPTTYSSFEASFPRTPPPSPPKLEHGRVTSNVFDQKATPPSVGRNKTVSPEGLANSSATSLPTPRPSLDSPDNPRHLPSLSPPSDPTDPTVIASSTPWFSLESANQSHAPSFDQVISRLKPLLDGTAGTAGERKISIVGISSDIVDKLRAKSGAGELPGWENLRYVGVL